MQINVVQGMLQTDILTASAKSHSRVQLSVTCGRQLARLLCPWNSPSKNTGVGCHFLLQGIFSTQGLKQ